MNGTPWRQLPADLAAAMRPDLPATVRTVTDAVTEAAPALASITDAKFDRDVRTAVRVALERFIELVGTDAAALPQQLREFFVGLGAAEAREDRGPDAVLAAYRTAGRCLLRAASEALVRVRPLDPDVLIDLSDAVAAFVDELAAASTDGYARQLQEQAGEGDRRRRLAELLLRGGAPEAVVATTAAGIGWSGITTVTPVVLPLDHARDARFRFGADGVLIERPRDAVLLVRDGPRATRPHLADILAGRGAVAGPTVDWPRAPEAVRLAELTADLVEVAADPVFADDYLGTLALRGEPGALAVLAARRLAPLEHLRPAQRDVLLATLYSWLRHWGARTEVSAELFVHPQTVSYRVGRLRDLLGADLDDPAGRFELLLVLAARYPPFSTTG